jgi:hypothetical protein
MSANVMTREQKLYAMRMVDLVEVAEKLGVKIDKKGKKSTAVLKILKAEENVAGDGTPLAEVGKEIAQQAKEKANDAKKVKPPTFKDKDGLVESVKKKDTKKKAKKTAKVDAIDVVENVCKNNNWSYSRKGKFLRVLDENGKNIAPIYRRPGAVRIYVKNSEDFDKKIIIKSDSEAYGKRFAGSVFVTIENIGKVLEMIVKNSKKEGK